MAHRSKVRGSLKYDHRGPVWGCSRREHRMLLQIVTTLELPAGYGLAHQGRRDGQFVILVEGNAAVLRDDSLIEQLTSGAHVGGLTVVRGRPHPTTVVALTPVVVDVICERDFRGVVPLLERFNKRVLNEVDRQQRDWCDTGDVTRPLVDRQSGTRPAA